MGDYKNKATKRYSLDTSNNLYPTPNQNPNYPDRFQPENIREYKDSVYDRISELLLQNWSKIEPYVDGVGFSALQKTYRNGKLVSGKKPSEMLVVYESDIDANADDSKIENALMSWLDFIPVSHLQLSVITTVEVVQEGKPEPPNLILHAPDRQDFNINEIVGSLELKDINLTDNVSQFMSLEKVSSNISRKKLDENIDTQFNELSPITFTDKIDIYQKAKSEVPFFRYRTDDFFKEYSESKSVPLNYRIEKLFEEFERIKSDIPPGRLLPYDSTIPLLSELTDERLFDWETLTYLVAESQDMIGTTNPIFSQEQARSWQTRITDLVSYGSQMSGSWDICEKRLRAMGDGFSDATGSIDVADVEGCTDPLATNYNADATTDNGTCTYAELGIEVFAQGSGFNNNNQRILRLGDTFVYNEPTNDDPNAGRGFRMTVISADTIVNGVWNGTTKFDDTYDVYANESEQTAMAEDILKGLNTWALNDLFVITSYDAVGYNELLVEALKSVGGCYPRLVNGIGSTNDDGLGDANARTPYVLVGSKGLGECSGYESVGDDGASTPPSIIQIEWNPFLQTEFTGDMGSPDPIYGCTDSTANNYDQYADTDDGSCTYDAIMGCTDPLAENYNMDAEEDDGSCLYVVTPEFEETFDNWPDVYSPSNYFFRSVTSNSDQQWSIGQVLKTDGPEGAEDTGVRIYRTRENGLWPGALFNPNHKTRRIDPTWVGAEAREPEHVYLEEDRTYIWSGWGRCDGDNSNNFATVFVGDTRGGDSENNWDYSWRETGTWDTGGEWTKHEFEFTPVKNKHVSKGKWKVDFIVKLDQDGNITNFGAKPSFNPRTTPDPNSDYIVKTEYWTTLNKDWGSGNVVTNFVHDFGEGMGGLRNEKDDVMIRVTGMINVTTANYKKFAIVHDDGVRVYIDGELEIDEWRDTGATWSYSDEIYMSEGLHEVEIHWYESGGGADLRDFRKAGGSYGSVSDSDAKTGDLVEHASKDLITSDDTTTTLYPGVMMNMYLYPGTSGGSSPGDYCDYANIKVTPKEMRAGGKFRTGGIASSANPGPTNEVMRDIRIRGKEYKRTMPKPFNRTTPIVSSANPGPTNEVYNPIVTPKRTFDLGPKVDSTNIGQSIQPTNCQSERMMLQRASTLPLNKMLREIESWLENNPPCLGVTKTLHEGGEVGHTHCCPDLCGDVSGDGSVNVLDVIRMVGIVTETTIPTEDEFGCADVNNDGIVNVIDVVQLVNAVLNSGINLNCNYCSDEPGLCTGIIGCDNVCYTEHNGTAINGPDDVDFLPISARWDAAGVCGGGTFDCDTVCEMNYNNMISIGNNCETDWQMGSNPCCTNLEACRTYRDVATNENGEYYVIQGSWDGLCSWEFPEGPCHHQQSGERGGLFRRRR